MKNSSVQQSTLSKVLFKTRSEQSYLSLFDNKIICIYLFISSIIVNLYLYVTFSTLAPLFHEILVTVETLKMNSLIELIWNVILESPLKE